MSPSVFSLSNVSLPQKLTGVLSQRTPFGLDEVFGSGGVYGTISLICFHTKLKRDHFVSF